LIEAMGAADDKPSSNSDPPINAPAIDIDRLLGLDLPAASLIRDGASPMPAAEAAGDLSENDFVLLLGRAFTRAFTGRLHLRSLDGEATVWFSAGLVVDVAVSDVSAAERASASSARIEHWLFQVAGWRDGSFHFEAPRDPELQVHRVHALRHPAALGYETLLRRDADRALEFWRGDRSNRFRLCWPAVIDVLFGLEPDLRIAVRLFDGDRTFAEVVKGSQVNEGRILKAAFLLFCFGALTAANDEAATTSLSFDKRAHSDRERIEALYKLAEESDYFTFLGVDREASRHEVLAAAERMRRELRPDEQHPDVVLATGRQRAVITEVLDEAVRVLGDDGLRGRHRAALAEDS
jgi:hypothetical protein